MEIIIRLAQAEDAKQIAETIEKSHGATANAKQVQRIILEDDHISLVAEVESKIVGFVDGFITIASDGTRRWELDLLGVHPDFHGNNIGKKLITEVTQAGKEYMVDLTRALVAIENYPMHSAISKTGYKKQSETQYLYVSSDVGKPIKAPETAHLIPVNTMTYSGIWLEGVISQEAIHVANAIREKHGWDVIGAVISESDSNSLKIIENAGHFHLIGKYNWWIMA